MPSRPARMIGLGSILILLPFVLAPGSNDSPVPPAHRPRKGPELERWYFAQWHQPYGAVLPQEYLKRIWDDIHALPSEEEIQEREVNSWELLGPSGIHADGGATYSGRVLDLEIPAGALLRVGSASGGLWGHFLGLPYPMSDGVSSLVASTLATDPNDPNHIWLGTGEYRVRSGTGLWETTDGGGTWSHVTLWPEPSDFFRIRYAPNDPMLLHAATSAGYFRSVDGGQSWTQVLDGIITDIAICRDVPNVIYLGRLGDGLLVSLDAGGSWISIIDDNGNLPTNDIGRISLAVSATDPARAYSSWVNASDGRCGGIYVTDGGANRWLDRSAGNICGEQGWYDNVIACSPIDANLVLAGGTGFVRSTNGGVDWQTVSSPDLHADHHAILWDPDGLQVWEGNDGGWTYSSDAGLTWTTASNLLPITQFFHLGIGTSDPNRIGGGAQDNGVCMTLDASNWSAPLGADGGGFAVDPVTSSRIWASNGIYWNDPLRFKRFRTTNSGSSWQEVDNGIDPSTQWAPQIEHDRVDPVYLFTNADYHVYRSTDFGDNWTKVNPVPFSAGVSSISVPTYSGASRVWACLGSAVPGDRLYFFDGASWSERSAGLPQGAAIRRIAVHPSSPDLAYALINGAGHPTQKIYRTADQGQNWTNITGDLPDLPLGALVPHPTDDLRLYLGTEMGCYRTTDGGGSWHRWNNGMPEAAIITEMSWIDDLQGSGQFWVVAATYGRSVWRREVAGEDPAGAAGGSRIDEISPLLRLRPNPAHSRLTLEVRLPAPVRSELRFYDPAGRQVGERLELDPTRGGQIRVLQVDDWAAGVYFARLRAGGRETTGRFVVSH